MYKYIVTTTKGTFDVCTLVDTIEEAQKAAAAAIAGNYRVDVRHTLIVLNDEFLKLMAVR